MRTKALATLLLLTALVPGCYGQRDDKRADATLLDSLPRYPGAREVSRAATVKTEDERQTGWTVNAVYSVPQDVTEEQVLEFYRAGLTGWSPDGECCGGMRLVASYRRGSALMSVNVDNVANVHTYELHADAHETEEQ